MSRIPDEPPPGSVVRWWFPVGPGTAVTEDGVYVQQTEYTVSVVPPGHPERDDFEITVAWRDTGRWAVLQRGRQCLGADGAWDRDSIPSGREDEWLAAHRFDLDTALRLAREAAPKVRANGRTFTEWEAHWAALDAAGGGAR